ncbi:MAG TPA: Rid family hydrolase [Sphingomicrobium sp.]|nr:Rid family hydrolase [Sphingomicrobium sp.]
MRSTLLIPILILAAPAIGQAGTRQEAKVLLSEDPGERKFQEDWGYADAIVVGDTVYLSGVVAGLRPGETDLTLAYERAFTKIGGVLKRSGAAWDDVVDITSYHTDLTTQMPAIVAVKKKYMRSPPPAWTAIGVSRLIPNSGVTEIKMIAKLPPFSR